MEVQRCGHLGDGLAAKGKYADTQDEYQPGHLLNTNDIAYQFGLTRHTSNGEGNTRSKQIVLPTAQDHFL